MKRFEVFIVFFCCFIFSTITLGSSDKTESSKVILKKAKHNQRKDNLVKRNILDGKDFEKIFQKNNDKKKTYSALFLSNLTRFLSLFCIGIVTIFLIIRARLLSKLSTDIWSSPNIYTRLADEIKDTQENNRNYKNYQNNQNQENQEKTPIQERKQHSYDIIIIGAGNAGTLLALNLVAKQDVHIALIDSDWKHQKRIVGELIQPLGIDLLASMGFLNPCVLASFVDPIPCFGYSIEKPGLENGKYIRGEKETSKVILPYPSTKPYTFLEHLGFLQDGKTRHEIGKPIDRNMINNIRIDSSKTCSSMNIDPLNMYQTNIQKKNNIVNRNNLINNHINHYNDNNHNNDDDIHSNASTQPFSPVNNNNNNNILTPPSPLAYCFHNGRFVQLIRDLAIKHPRITCIEGYVSDVSSIPMYEKEKKGYKNNSQQNSQKVLHNITEIKFQKDFKIVKSIPDNELHEYFQNKNTQVINNGNTKNNKNNENNENNENNDEHYTTLNCSDKLNAPLSILCDGGKSIQLRKTYSRTEYQPKLLCTWIGLLLEHDEYDSPISNPGYASVVLATPSPVLLYQISPIHTRLLVCTTDQLIKDVCPDNPTYNQYLKDIIIPQLPIRAGQIIDDILITHQKEFGAYLQHPLKSEKNYKNYEKTQKNHYQNDFVSKKYIKTYTDEPIVSIKNNYYLPAVEAEQSLPGYILFGDALNMRHALTGSGISILLSDVINFTNLMEKIDVNDWKAVQDIQKQFVSRRRGYAGTLNSLACCLPDVVSMSNGKKKERIHLTNSLYSYLQCGGPCSKGPIGLLSGLTPSPLILTIHFFLVVLYGSFLSLKRLDVFSIFSVMHEGVCIIMPFLKKEKISILSKWPLRQIINGIFPLDDRS